MALRQIMLDTETTGLDPKNGDRVVEIGCVELVGRKLTGRKLHLYLNPEREVPLEAQRIHGLTDEFLADKPKFSEVAAEFADFVRDAELVIHNAAFDVGFLNAEFARINQGAIGALAASVVDTLKMARDMRPGKRNSLDALCSEYGIDNSNRQYHGALLDSELLAEVYLAMTRGQESLIMDLDQPSTRSATPGVPVVRPALRVVRASAEELAAHDQVLQEIAKASKGKCLWLAGEAPASP
jgi:DNA polymerase III subunit epsilon